MATSYCNILITSSECPQLCLTYRRHRGPPHVSRQALLFLRSSATYLRLFLRFRMGIYGVPNSRTTRKACPLAGEAWHRRKQAVKINCSHLYHIRSVWPLFGFPGNIHNACHGCLWYLSTHKEYTWGFTSTSKKNSFARCSKTCEVTRTPVMRPHVCNSCLKTV